MQRENKCVKTGGRGEEAKIQLKNRAASSERMRTETKERRVGGVGPVLRSRSRDILAGAGLTVRLYLR